MTKSTWKRKLLISLMCCCGLVAAAIYSFTTYATPIIRESVEHPLYTVGDENYSKALNEDKKIVKFGPLPLGVYSGGVAFNNPEDARKHLVALGKEDTWGVYRLSGDFELDSQSHGEERFTNKSLLVMEQIQLPEPRSYLTLDYQQFDQTPDAGWRIQAADGKYTEAAAMLDTYASSKSSLSEQQKRILMFHAGQMHAYAGNYPSAIASFEKSMTAEQVDSPIEWNAYVKSTIAFLKDDIEELKRCREKIAAGPKIQGMVPNLNVVDSLISNIGKPYATAYDSHRGMKPE